MPVTDMKQAQIKVTSKQIEALVSIRKTCYASRLVIEETNLGDAIAVRHNDRTFIVPARGEVHELKAARR